MHTSTKTYFRSRDCLNVTFVKITNQDPTSLSLTHLIFSEQHIVKPSFENETKADRFISPRAATLTPFLI